MTVSVLDNVLVMIKVVVSVPVAWKVAALAMPCHIEPVWLNIRAGIIVVIITRQRNRHSLEQRQAPAVAIRHCPLFLFRTNSVVEYSLWYLTTRHGIASDHHAGTEGAQT